METTIILVLYSVSSVRGTIILKFFLQPTFLLYGTRIFAGEGMDVFKAS